MTGGGFGVAPSSGQGFGSEDGVGDTSTDIVRSAPCRILPSPCRKAKGGQATCLGHSAAVPPSP
jgi:hypothetical protein